VLIAHCTHTYLLIRDNAFIAHQVRLLLQWVSVLHALMVLGPRIKESVNQSHWFALLQSVWHVLLVLTVDNAAKQRPPHQNQLLQLQLLHQSLLLAMPDKRESVLHNAKHAHPTPESLQMENHVLAAQLPQLLMLMVFAQIAQLAK
jgi:hypothetical protein